MAAQIRQEINVLDTPLAAGAESNERILLDTTQYNGATYYFEVLYSVSSGTGAVQLRLPGGANRASIGSLTGSTYQLARTSFTPTAGSETLVVNSSGFTTVKAARVIIIQNATTLTNTETQIEIGNASNTTATVDTALTDPKYWKYTAANWDGTLTAYFESTFLSATSKSAATMTLQTSTSITAPSWSNVASSAVTTVETVPTRVRSGAISLVDGNWYRAVMKAGNSKSGITTYNAKIIIRQLEGGNLINDNNAAPVKGGTAGAGQVEQAEAQAFTISNASSISGVKLKLRKVGSPTDTISVDLVSSLGGASLANGTITSSSLTTSFAIYNITFSAPYSASAATTYYIQITRSPDTNDTTNYVEVNFSGAAAQQYPNGNRWERDNNSWSDLGTISGDIYFELTGITGITKLEPQYLLANTLFAAGTGLQTFLTKWDSTEWDAGAGSISYYFQAEAANDSTSDVTLDEADGGGVVTNSTLTNIDNAQISAAMTMPTSQNLDTKATTNAGDVAAARILVAYTFSAQAAIVNTPYNGNQMFTLLGVGT